MFTRKSAPSRVIVRAIHGYADSMQIKHLPDYHCTKRHQCVIGARSKLADESDIKEAPGNQRGSGTYSPNGIRRILSYCEISRPSSFMSIAEL
jgi:hypothetical protein